MAIEAVQELVTKLKSVQAQISEKQAEREELKKAHLDFWKKFQQECRETGHSLTDKEKDAFANPDKYNTGRLTVFEYNMMMLRADGYQCAYCLEKVTVGVEDWNPKLDLSKRESFKEWIGYQEEKWPTEKRAILRKVKKEVEEYFSKAEPLEQELADLEKKRKEICGQVQEIFDLCDGALRITEALRKQLNNAQSSDSGIPYDPDDPRGYFHWDAWH